MSQQSQAKRTFRIYQSDRDLAALFGCDQKIFRLLRRNPSDFYNHFTVVKRNGKTRDIYPPREPLKQIQKRILQFAYGQVRLPHYVHGGVPRRSPVTHASPHIGRTEVLTMDIRDFFPSTPTANVQRAFENLGFSCEALDSIVSAVTLNGGLPQGSPTSCLVANLAFLPCDERIWRLSRRNEMRYGRYVDDLALSSNLPIASLTGTVKEIVESFCYKIARSKTVLMTASERQVVTGLVVNDKLRPTREFIRCVSDDIRYCIEEGPDRLAAIMNLSVTQLKRQLNGKVSHIRNTDPELGTKLRKRLCGVQWKKRTLAYSD